jgi:hypothetical protein
MYIAAKSLAITSPEIPLSNNEKTLKLDASMPELSKHSEISIPGDTADLKTPFMMLFESDTLERFTAAVVISPSIVESVIEKKSVDIP